MLRAEQSGLLKIAALSVGLVTLSFLLQGRSGVTYSDAGFLWYGAVHTLAGEVPAGETYQGFPAGPEREMMKATLAVRRLPEMRQQLRQLQREVQQLQQQITSLQRAPADSAAA